MQTIANKVQEQLGSEPSAAGVEYKARADGKTMKALAWFGSTDVRVIDAPIPDITEPNDVILQVTGSTICGSDLLSSRVTFLGMSLQNYMYGMRDAGFFGYSHFTGGFPGGQAEYVRVPFGNVNLLPIPDNVTDEQALYLSDVLPTSYHSVVDTGVEKGDVVGIWGLGPIGQCAARWAKLKGASRVIGIDQVPERLAFGKEKSGIEVVDFSKDKDVAKKLHEMIPGGLDVALDCGTFHEPKTMMHKIQKMLMLETDVPETVNEMIVSVRKMGRCGIIAAYAGFTNGFNIGALMEKGIRLIGNGQAPVHKYWEEILDLIKAGKFDPTFMITHRVPLEDMSKLYAAFDKRQAGVEKVFVETLFSSPPSKGCPQLTRVADWLA